MTSFKILILDIVRRKLPTKFSQHYLSLFHRKMYKYEHEYIKVIQGYLFILFRKNRFFLEKYTKKAMDSFELGYNQNLDALFLKLRGHVYNLGSPLRLTSKHCRN